MLTTVEGTFKNGKVELDERAAIPEGARVIVTVLPVQKQEPQGRMMTFGMLREPGRRLSTWEDFEEAKKIWEPKERP